MADVVLSLGGTAYCTVTLLTEHVGLDYWEARDEYHEVVATSRNIALLKISTERMSTACALLSLKAGR